LVDHSLPAHFFAILNVFPAFVYNSAASSVFDEPLQTNWPGFMHCEWQTEN